MRYNYNFAKLVDGTLHFAPVPILLTTDLCVDDVTHMSGAMLYTDRADVFAQLGYKPVQRTDAPTQEGYYHTETWTETENAIVQGWEEHEIPAPELDPLEEVIDVMEGTTP